VLFFRSQLHLVPPLILFLAQHPAVAKFDLTSVQYARCHPFLWPHCFNSSACNSRCWFDLCLACARSTILSGAAPLGAELAEQCVKRLNLKQLRQVSRFCDLSLCALPLLVLMHWPARSRSLLAL
jgi:hypothetical protein